VLAAGNFRPRVVFAGIGFQPPNPEELKMTSEPLAPGAPAVILYRQVDRDDNGMTSHEDDYIRIKVLTEEGRKYANVEIPFYKGINDVVHLRARTIRPDGTIAEFDGKVYESTVEKTRGWKYLAKTFNLPDVQIGSIIEYYFSYDYKEHLIYDSNWVLSHELFTKSAKFSLKPYSGYSSVPLNLRWNWHSLPPGATPKQGPDRIVRMEAVNIPAFETEDYMPPPNDRMARVDFIYSEDAADKDAEAFWKRIGKKRNGQLESFVGKQKAMEAAVAQIVSPTDAPEVKLRKIYDRVQQIRNTSYEVTKTEQEEKRAKEKRAENVEEVWKRGYGDGGQLTWLYLALVRAAGFEAYGVWVSDRRNHFFNRAITDASRLDANVVLVKLNGQDLYFDPGALFTPFGLLTWSETGVDGLKLDKDGGSWVKSRLPASSESRIDRVAKLKLTDEGDLEGKLTVTYTGLEAMYHRLDHRYSDEVERKKYLEDGVKSQIPAASDVELTNHPDWTSSETPMMAEYDIKIPGWAAGAGKRVLLRAGIFTEAEKNLFEHTNRVHPIYFDYPYQKNDDVTIDLPSDLEVDSVPKGVQNDSHVVSYTLKVEGGKDYAKDKLHITRKLSVDFLLLDAKYYPALRSFYQTVRTKDDEQIVLQSPTATANN
jgi:hypothetical protein